MKMSGMIVAIAGLLALLVSFGIDTAPEGTHNIGLLQKQMMVFQLGAVLALIGAVLFATGRGLQRLEIAGIIPAADIKAPLGKPGASR
jgi:hypothetical protein